MGGRDVEGFNHDSNTHEIESALQNVPTHPGSCENDMSRDTCFFSLLLHVFDGLLHRRERGMLGLPRLLP